MHRYDLSEEQANAILDMRLRRLAAMERAALSLELRGEREAPTRPRLCIGRRPTLDPGEEALGGRASGRQHSLHVRQHVGAAIETPAAAMPVGDGVQLVQYGVVVEPRRGCCRDIRHEEFRRNGSKSGLLQKLWRKVTPYQRGLAPMSVFSR